MKKHNSKNRNSQKFKSVEIISKDLDIVNNFILRNWKKYLILVCVFLLICVVYFSIIDFINYRNQIRSNNLISANSIDEIQKEIKHNNSLLSQYIRLKLAALLVQDEKYDKALKLYKLLKQKSKDTYIKNISSLNEAYLLETLGNKKDAIDVLHKLIKDNSLTESLYSEVCFSLGRLYLDINDEQQAGKWFQKCINSNEDDLKANANWEILAKVMLNTM